MFNTIRDQTVCANSQSALLLCQGTGAGGGGGGGGSSSSSVLTSTSISTSDSLLTSTSTSTSSSLISSCFLTRTGPTGSGAESSYSGSGISPPWVTRDEVTVAHLGESSMNKFGQVWSSFHEQNASKKHSPHMLSCWPRAFGPCRKNLTGLKVMSIQNYTWLVQQKYKTWWIHVRRPIGNKRKLRKNKKYMRAKISLQCGPRLHLLRRQSQWWRHGGSMEEDGQMRQARVECIELYSWFLNVNVGTSSLSVWNCSN